MIKMTPPERIWVFPCAGCTMFAAEIEQVNTDTVEYVRADRIAELEAKLEVATRALEAIARPKTGPDADWTMPEIYRWRAIWYLRHEERARTTLAELKGGRK